MSVTFDQARAAADRLLAICERLDALYEVLTEAEQQELLHEARECDQAILAFENEHGIDFETACAVAPR